MLIEPGKDSPRPSSEGQNPNALDETILLHWNDLDTFERVLGSEGHDIAAVIMEPVMFNAEAIEPAAGYLEGVRAACTLHGVVLIFDEVITGFRLALGGAVEYYGVQPDLATYGKALAGGWPVAALAGRAEVMDVLSDGRVNHSGTFNGSVMAAAATIATLSMLRDEPPYERIAAYGRALMTGLDDLSKNVGFPLVVQGLPVAFHVSPSGVARSSLGTLELHHALASAGVWVTTRGIWYVSATHRKAELDLTLESADAAVRALGSERGRLEELRV
jgi:glutamate-1-semialdehyde 2,1-aminomutase